MAMGSFAGSTNMIGFQFEESLYAFYILNGGY